MQYDCHTEEVTISSEIITYMVLYQDIDSYACCVATSQLHTEHHLVNTFVIATN